MVSCINKKIIRDYIVLFNQGCHAYMFVLVALFYMTALGHAGRNNCADLLLSTAVWLSIRCLLMGVHGRHMMVLLGFF